MVQDAREREQERERVPREGAQEVPTRKRHGAPREERCGKLQFVGDGRVRSVGRRGAEEDADLRARRGGEEAGGARWGRERDGDGVEAGAVVEGGDVEVAQEGPGVVVPAARGSLSPLDGV